MQLFRVGPVTAMMLIAATLPAQAGPFDKGRKSFSLNVGSGSAFRGAYTVVGLGMDYVLEDGVLVGGNAQGWFGSGPDIYKISLRASYVFNRQAELKPYAGGFYRQTFIENLDDLASAGGRFGVYFNNGNGVQMGVGYVFESYLNCDTGTFGDCTDSYPEVVMQILL